MPPDSSNLSSLIDQARLAALFEEHSPRLLAMLERRIDPRLRKLVDAEVVLQEAFLNARKRWKDFQDEGEGRAYAWLYRIAYHTLIDLWRKHTCQRDDVRADLPWPEESSVQLGFGLVHPGTSPTQAAAREDLRRRMARVMELLRPEDREVLWMRHRDGLTHAEAGGVLGLSENAATVRYVRALRRLKDVWEKLNPESEFPS